MKRGLKYLFLITFSVVVALAMGEIALRLIGFPMPRILQREQWNAVSTRPRAQFVYQGYLPGTFVDCANPVTLNSNGFHDREYEQERPTTNTYRVLVLGDSYVAALSIPLEKIFHKIIEQQLNANDPLGRGHYEVIAVGQGRSSQKAELRWLRTYGQYYRPDAVLLMFFCGNDVMENSDEIMADAGLFGRRFETQILPRKQALFNRLLLLKRSRVNGLIAEAITTFYAAHLDRFDQSIRREDLISPELGVYEKPLRPVWEQAYATTGELLDQIRAARGDLQLPLLIGCLESPQAMGDAGRTLLQGDRAALDFEQPANWLKAWCEQRGVPFCNLEPALEKAGWRSCFWRHDGHLNPRGNEVIAAPLYDFIIAHAPKN